jgi:hypothetical protein
MLSMLPPVQWDRLTLKAFAGVAAVIASGTLLLAGVGLVVPMMWASLLVSPRSSGPVLTGSSFASRLSKRRLGLPSP